MRRREKRGTKRCGAGPVAGGRYALDYFLRLPLKLTQHRLRPFMGFCAPLTTAPPTALAQCLLPDGHPQTQLFQALAGLASFGTASLPPHPARRVTNHHVLTLARGVQAENSHTLITNVIKRYNWIAYQPLEFTNCNVAGAPYATSDPVFSLASARSRVRDRFLPQRTFD